MFNVNKIKTMFINITVHVLQLQRVITWYRIERLLYMNYPAFFLSWVDTCHKSTAVSAEGARDTRKASDVQQKPETGWGSIGRDSRRLHWVFSGNSPKKPANFIFKMIVLVVLSPDFSDNRHLSGTWSVYILRSLFYLLRGKIVRILSENCPW